MSWSLVAGRVLSCGESICLGSESDPQLLPTRDRPLSSVRAPAAKAGSAGADPSRQLARQEAALESGRGVPAKASVGRRDAKGRTVHHRRGGPSTLDGPGRIRKCEFTDSQMSKTSIKSRVSRGSKRTTAARRSAVRRPVVVRYVVRFLLGNGLGRSGASAELLAQLRRGLPVSEVEELRAAMALRREELAPLLGISKATLHRRWAAGRFGAAESDRVARYARLFGLATVALESTELARGWLGSPQRGLGGAVPLQFAESELGAREVEDLLLRSEHGVYS